MRVGLVLAMLAFCLAFVKSEADSCVGYPAVVPFGGHCDRDSGINCQLGSYCNIASVCTANLKVGSECHRDYDQCEFGASCKGPDGYGYPFKAYCVLDAHPGQECSSDSYARVAQCGNLLNCNGDSVTCDGGHHGDSCFKNEDCLSEICDEASRTCVGLANGKTCPGNNLACLPGSFCNIADNKCKALKTSGDCDSDSECAFGYACFKAKESDSATKCFQIETKEAGTYCESAVECISKRCIEGFCASSTMTSYCTDSDQCSSDQVCHCNGNIYEGGFGKCVDFPCAKLRADFRTCIYTHCHPVANNPFNNMNFYFNGSCTLNNCKEEVDQYMLCADASGLVASLFSVAFAAFFAAFFSKRI